MHTQNLRDSDHAIKNFYFHWRGWLRRFKWEIALRKSWTDDVIRFEVRLGGHEPRDIHFSFCLLGKSVYLQVHNVLPQRWAVGGDTKAPGWFEDSMGRVWGFYIQQKNAVFHWNASVGSSGKDRKKFGYTKFIYFPWDWGGSIRWDVQREDGSFAPVNHEYGKDPLGPFQDGRKVYQAPYTYNLESGEVQSRTATFHVMEQEWRWRWFRKLRIGPKILSRSITVTFDKEVGERSGSWKGGCTGCGYEMKKGETAIDTLRRMEKERKF